MIILPDAVLTESISARDHQMAEMSNDHATELLCKAKAIIFALWQGAGIATTQQIAEYYEVSIDTVKKVIQRHRAELESDGLRTLKGKELKALCSKGSDAMSLAALPEKTTVLTTWTPRACVRLGMLLTTSEIAQQLRTFILDLLTSANPPQSTSPIPDPPPIPALLPEYPWHEANLHHDSDEYERLRQVAHRELLELSLR